MKTSKSIHSNKTSFHRGSALLVVLGMLAFMIISAVAFSAWMRSTRLPNSFLRRSSAARMLAKAALAAAIDEVDVAIGNNPHPGVGHRQYSFRSDGHVRGTGENANRNHWMGRVFIGRDDSDNNDSENAKDHLVDPAKTVSTLNLEGLAYIPPPFVTEARYYSRRSNAAKWHNLAFDSGRYAFCAIDVSDCFDVNRLAANVGRSTSPYGRISLAYLFENRGADYNSGHTSYVNDPKSWDDFMKEYFRQKSLAEVEVANGDASGRDVVDNSKVPVTSVADLNLAMYAKGADSGVAGLKSPFSKYVTQSGSSFYGGSLPESADGQMFGSMAFVADSWLPQGAATTPGDFDQPQLDLAQEVNQPFTSAELAKDNKMTAMTAAEKYQSGTATVGQRLYKRLGGMGMALLKDYLDEDNVPISLGLPQVERAPMVAAIKHEFGVGGSLAVTVKKVPDGDPLSPGYAGVVEGGQEGSKTRKVRWTCTYSLDPAKFMPGIEQGLTALVVYPFRHGRDVSDADTFKIDAHVDVFLSSEPMQLRTGNRADLFHSDGMGEESKFAETGFYNGFFRIGFQPLDCTFSDVTDEQSAMKLVSLTPSSVAQITTALNSGAGKLFEVVWEEHQTRTIDENGVASGWQKDGEDQRVAATCGITPIAANGTVDESFRTPAAVLSYLAGNHNKTANIRAAITIRIKNGDNKVVDMVPGGLLDDQVYNSINNLGSMEEMGNIISGRPGPLMLLNGGGLTLGDTEFDANPGEVPFALQPKGMMCADPRWNWAPEHWFAQDSVDQTTWRQNCQVGQEGRDRDIFMMSGDARYMQSVYELACLPRLTTLENYGTDQMRGNMDQLSDAAFTGIPANFADTRNRHLAWRTYNPYYRRGVDGYEVHPNSSLNARRDPFELLNIVNRGNGFLLNPFSDSTNVTVAAFANSPTDWWTAGLDPAGSAGVDDSTRQNAKQFNQKHVFSEINTKAKFAWRDIRRIASNFVFCLHDSKVAREAYEVIEGREGLDMIWQQAFDECLDWSGDCTPGHETSYGDYFGTVIPGTVENTVDGYRLEQLDGNTTDLYDVDRKFLYGYWRECFAVKQQLFLVFVRAEPMMLGGGAVGAVPPQLGSRAVALVWRDPAPAVGHETDIKYPHKTRVLFYRQLD